MPYKVEKRKGAKPWKVVNKNTGKVRSSHTSKELAESSRRAREGAKRGRKPTGKKRVSRR